MVLYFKSCLRCKDGTVELGSDNFGTFLNCLTCGYTINSRSIRSNGSIEELATRQEDVVPVPVPVPGMGPVVATGNVDAHANGVDSGGMGRDFGPDPDIGTFEDELEELVVGEEAAAI